MKKGTYYIALAITLITINFPSIGQSHTDTNNWFLKDPETDNLQGVSVDKTYQMLLKDKPSKTVLVAVIDSGIDIEHEDLDDIIWTNEDEIPGNGIDDDQNGYVDDIHGWNFLGNQKGENVNGETLEVTREYVRLKTKFKNQKESKIKKKEKKEFQYWLKVKNDFKTDSADAKMQYDQYHMLYQNISYCNDTLKSLLETDKIDPKALNELELEDQRLKMARMLILNLFISMGAEIDIDEVLSEIKNALDHFSKKVEYGYNPNFNSREIIGDSYTNLYEKGYGNNDVKGPDASHGTHVAGIIGAIRGNQIGIDGIANNVKIMSIRAVPNGDEHDKDVANAILYAVDNGAEIINMSFGKAYSPHKEAVDKAITYAESKGVLLIHAAGNEGLNIDQHNNFPTRFHGKKNKELTSWIEVGAISAENNDQFVASFSNYGKKTVQIFAPGVDIYSTVPDNKYKSNNGTSMASPAVTGVAAVIKSYFPHLSAGQIKEILLKSSRKYADLKVIKPGTDDESTSLKNISVTGGVIDAYEAVKMAQSIDAAGQ